MAGLRERSVHEAIVRVCKKGRREPGAVMPLCVLDGFRRQIALERAFRSFSDLGLPGTQFA